MSSCVQLLTGDGPAPAPRGGSPGSLPPSGWRSSSSKCPSQNSSSARACLQTDSLSFSVSGQEQLHRTPSDRDSRTSTWYSPTPLLDRHALRHASSELHEDPEMLAAGGITDDLEARLANLRNG